MGKEMYLSGEYFEKHPTWGVEDSLWKAENIIRTLEQNGIQPRTICEVGCGAGEILYQLQCKMNPENEFYGYDISPQAIELCRNRSNERLHFELQDILQENNVFFDLILLMDVIEHVEDYFSFLRGLKTKSTYKLFHIPLNLSVQAIIRPDALPRVRKICGHIHYFTKELALQVLKELEYEILEWSYTNACAELPAKSKKAYFAKLSRNLLFAINGDFSVRLFGGRSLMVLAR